MIKVSILLTQHRHGGQDVLTYGLERQTFDKNDWELILCDKLYNERKDFIEDWANKHDINLIHFEPKNQSEYHIHSSVLNECLEKAQGKYSIIIGDYSYVEPWWINAHYQYNEAGYCLSAPQRIYALPKLKDNITDPISIFLEPFHPNVLETLAQFSIDSVPVVDQKLLMPVGSIIDFRFWYNRNESFPTEKAKEIGGWDERYNGRVGESNLEFGLRMQYEAGCKIATDKRVTIHRILSYCIPPFTKFLCSELDSSINHERYIELCKKHGVL